MGIDKEIGVEEEEVEVMSEKEKEFREAGYDPEYHGALPVDSKRGFGLDFSFLTKPTGEGDVEDYLQHPMNWEKSMEVAQILRGFTGMFGDMALAVIDIIFGFFKFSTKKKRNESNESDES